MNNIQLLEDKILLVEQAKLNTYIDLIRNSKKTRQLFDSIDRNMRKSNPGFKPLKIVNSNANSIIISTITKGSSLNGKFNKTVLSDSIAGRKVYFIVDNDRKTVYNLVLPYVDGDEISIIYMNASKRDL